MSFFSFFFFSFSPSDLSCLSWGDPSTQQVRAAMTALSSVEVWEAGVARNVREDGRERTEFRRLTITEGVVDHAMGSAQVDLGDTK